MFFGWLVRGKRYAPAQVGAVLLVSAGVVLAALARPNAPAPAAAATAAAAGPPTQYALGITMLVASLFLSGWLGMLQEQTYELYGPHWREGMFYTVRARGPPAAHRGAHADADGGTRSTRSRSRSSCSWYKTSRTGSRGCPRRT
jgi:hypothetical protein